LKRSKTVDEYASELLKAMLGVKRLPPKLVAHYNAVKHLADKICAEDMSPAVLALVAVTSGVVDVAAINQNKAMTARRRQDMVRFGDIPDNPDELEAEGGDAAAEEAEEQPQSAVRPEEAAAEDAGGETVADDSAPEPTADPSYEPDPDLDWDDVEAGSDVMVMVDHTPMPAIFEGRGETEGTLRIKLRGDDEPVTVPADLVALTP